jgi:hypothetical protein
VEQNPLNDFTYVATASALATLVPNVISALDAINKIVFALSIIF